MKKQLIIIGIFVLLICVGLTGCTDKVVSDEERLVGVWQTTTSLYILIYNYKSDNTWKATMHSDGEVVLAGSGTWKIVDNRLLLVKIEPSSDTQTIDYVFTNNYNTITTTDENGSVMIFNRK